MLNNKIYNLLGLAMRARQLVTGEELVLADIKKGKCKLVIIAEDASASTTKKIEDKCKSYHIELVKLGTRYELGYAIGKATRVIIGVNNSGFAKSIRQLCD